MPDTFDWERKLLEMKTEIAALDEASSDARRSVELDQSRVGRLSRMDALQGQAMNRAIAVRRQQALQRLEAALRRLAAGEFGYCLECGEEIAVKRLELDPTVTFCTACSGRT